MYTLRRLTDDVWEYGSMSAAISDSDTLEHDARPRVGVRLRVGSLHGRSFAERDWWQTSRITKIVRDEPQQVEFWTEDGSYYLWRIDR